MVTGSVKFIDSILIHGKYNGWEAFSNDMERIAQFSPTDRGFFYEF